MVAEEPLHDGDDPDRRDLAAALQHERRRRAVELLAEHEDPLTLIGLVNLLSQRTDDPLPGILMQFHDLHLPELQDSGLVEYDDETGTIQLTPSRDVVEPALMASREEES